MFANFLANTGGLLGLFMGFSVVSILEIIYFVTLRPYYKYVKHMKNNKKMIVGTAKKPTAAVLHGFGKYRRRHQLTRVKPLMLDEMKNDRIFYPSLKY